MKRPGSKSVSVSSAERNYQNMTDPAGGTIPGLTGERNSRAPLGTERISQNGYHYVKIGEGDWKLKHHIVAEKKYGREIGEGERVVFKDKNRNNFHPDNIEILPLGKQSARRKLAQLIARRDEINSQIEELRKRIPGD